MYDMSKNEFTLTEDELKEMVEGWQYQKIVDVASRVQAYGYSSTYFDMQDLLGILPLDKFEDVFVAWLNSPDFVKACNWAQAWLDNNKQST